MTEDGKSPENNAQDAVVKDSEILNLNINGDQKIDVLADGTEILRDELEEFVEEKEEITDKDLLKLVEFTTGKKNMSAEELETLRNNEVELERLIRISMIKSKHFNYAPKKIFDPAYRKARQRKNKEAKKSRIANRK